MTATRHPRLVVAGEALIDLIQDPADPRTFHARPGGAPVNAAVAASRLGLHTAFLGRFSRDRFGDMLTRHLDDEGVVTSLSDRGDEPTSLAIAHLGADGGASYSFMLDGTTNRSMLAEDLPMLPADAALAVSLGAVTLDDEPMGQALATLARRESRRRLVTLDPNLRPSMIDDVVAYRATLDAVVGAVHVVKTSDEDLQVVRGADPLGQAADWVESGPALVVVTRGPDGATAFHREHGRIDVPGRVVDVVDTVGAGDSFGAALQAWFAEHLVDGPDAVAALDEADLRAALRFAVTVGALACTTRGADPPRRSALPTELA